MNISKGIRAKIFLFFSIMGILPVSILIIATALDTIDDLKDFGNQNSLLQNALVSEKLTGFVDKNLAVLQSLSMSPNVIAYLQEPTEERREYVEHILRDADELFADKNNIALTAADGWQLIRTDGNTLVNSKKRRYFQEAIKGNSDVSDIISSMSNGKSIIVLSMPVFNAEGKVIGVLQRNCQLDSLQKFVSEFNEQFPVIVMDRTGRVVVNTANSSDQTFDERYKFVRDKAYDTSGVIRVEFDGEDFVVTYSHNVDTGWLIVTVRPYRYIMDKVYTKALKAIIIGVTLILIGAVIAYMLTILVTKPIIEMRNTVDEIASGNTSITKVEVSGNDELGQLAAAFNKIRSERDAFQLESELDKLTELFNKKTMENLCKMKLKTYSEKGKANIFMAFYIIDLDHFKEVNDLLGHQFGDKVLVEFAKGLKKIFRPNDCLGRFGGDEFIVIVDSLPNMDIVLRKAEQIKQIAYNLTVEGKTRFVTASIGIAIAPQNGRDYESLFNAADKAVYHVKNNGKNGYYCQLAEEGHA